MERDCESCPLGKHFAWEESDLAPSLAQVEADWLKEAHVNLKREGCPAAALRDHAERENTWAEILDEQQASQLEGAHTEVLEVLRTCDPGSVCDAYGWKR